LYCEWVCMHACVYIKKERLFKIWGFQGGDYEETEGFENRVLRRIFGPKRDKVTGITKELHGLRSSPSIIRIIKSRRMRWVWHVAWMGRRGMHIGYWWESQREWGY
jgi:hypothetical protein